MNLVPSLFGFFKVGRQYDAAAGAVGFHRVRERGCVGHVENRLQHFDDVVKRVLFVIENNDVIQLAQFVFRYFLDICI